MTLESYNQGKLSYVGIYVPGLQQNTIDAVARYFEPKTNLVITDELQICKQCDLVVCNSDVWQEFDTPFVISYKETNIDYRYLYEPTRATKQDYTEKFLDYWLDRNFKNLNIPYLVNNPYQTILKLN